MKSRLSLLMSLLSAASVIGCQEARPDPRVAVLEQRVAQLESAASREAASKHERSEQLRHCIQTEPQAAYDNFLRLNSVAGRNGSYSVPMYIAAEARKQKQDKIEECKILYSN